MVFCFALCKSAVSPYINRFLQPDSIIPNTGNPQTWNRYSYTANNPILYIDPDGHCGLLCIGILVTAFFILNGTSDSYQPNISAEELASRQTSVELGGATFVTTLSIASPWVEAASNLYDCATLAYCDPSSWVVPGSASLYSNSADDVLTVRHYTDVETSVKITDSGKLYEGTYVTLPSQIPPRSGHLQIEELLEIEPGRGSVYVDLEIPTSNLKVPDNGLTTSNGAWQQQLVSEMKFPVFEWRRPPGRPNIIME